MYNYDILYIIPAEVFSKDNKKKCHKLSQLYITFLKAIP